MGRPLAAPEAQAQGLVLMVDGVADPLFEKEKVQPFRAGISYRARDGSRMAETAKGGLGSRQPGPKGAPRVKHQLCALVAKFSTQTNPYQSENQHHAKSEKSSLLQGFVLGVHDCGPA